MSVWKEYQIIGDSSQRKRINPPYRPKVVQEKEQQRIANLQKARNERANQRYILANGTLAERSKYHQEFSNSLKAHQQQQNEIKQKEREMDQALNSSVHAADIAKFQQYDARDRAYRERSKEFQQQNKLITEQMKERRAQEKTLYNKDPLISNEFLESFGHEPI